ncbi:MAG TPA: bifunctional [glutamine synthetase] adenylyltransferase/[glutamine synthetase]-adenylyl-L-tyrosine phosphorylase [Vitreimonas sp.]|uniref:bifunctional [glutamine synthetase] adenylyltransferase/[glutamine synthetase]-adenylyl-L-tyrosine phosphorylase n=1 Tax=Vitreimonas sp. TaxID=3069702 RepID=UPI002D5FDE43|nr:bifunctional [glutamine synthetase] adenylyltransferase/[glutamine synthetase]-adenylyl-L-tyrosine phosphorylase [Vitreimonas sp.]HYD89200.1 bifunctional [glutamine synthetase] adenylyltransferase/[glutamine synthetase]-adenylyl-L-tyrosine phosphorylase [Vitreimonas sp.]
MQDVGPALARRAAPAAFTGSPWSDAAASAVENAPYLKRLTERRPDLLENAGADWAERLFGDALRTADAIAADPPPLEEAMRTLRRTKDAVHLATALADLSRQWPLPRVTGALTDFADAALRAALSLGVRESVRRGDIEPAAATAEEGPIPGFTLIAMGKMGAGELNYSSDIDFSVFFDSARLAEANAREPRVAAVRLVAPIVRALEEVTVDGYVFRTDLRLRPDPGSTPVAVSIASAEHYYQTLGQNWERAAFIKARAAAGDRVCGGAFLASLEPFIWRKHLDFAAVEDVHSIKRQILSAHKSAELGDPVFDVKLGRGGIRDIELFAQTQQLILGGRNRRLREQRTLAALDALAAAGAISENARSALCEAYIFFREIEHRIQMLEDAQTHRVPPDPETRARVAALAGFPDLAAFDAALVERRKIVSDIDHQLFGRGESLADPLGSLIFTGVEDHPETLRTIEQLGFKQAAFVSQTVRGWHHGRIRAMRSERARELLTRLTPRLLRALAGAGDADQAFVRFASFFAGLSAGVQVLALLDARPALLDLLARILSVAPRLADNLARRPALLDALIEPRFAAPLAQDAPGAYRAELAERLSIAETFEQRLNAARRFQREEAFRIDVQVLEGQANAAEAGAAHADLAEACVAAMADAALAEVERRDGAQPGAFTVLALGKFGGRELAEGSDLDLMLVYEAAAEHATAGEFYARVTQRLISALSAPTEEGELYEIDTKLRPSGSKGPVAVRLSSFARYYDEEAWTWELQALTRLRAVAGDPALGRKVAEIAGATLAKPRDGATVLAEVADMRARMERERSARSIWDLKLAPGGFVDIEFIAQALQLAHAAEAPGALSPNTGEALQRLSAAGKIDPALADRLGAAWKLWSDLQHLLRICIGGEFDAADAPPPLPPRLAALAGAADFEALEAKVRKVQADVRAAFVQIIGPLGDGSQPLRR